MKNKNRVLIQTLKDNTYFRIGTTHNAAVYQIDKVDKTRKTVTYTLARTAKEKKWLSELDKRPTYLVNFYDRSYVEVIENIDTYCSTNP